MLAERSMRNIGDAPCLLYMKLLVFLLLLPPLLL
jgi:hypothetical protein